MPYHLTQHQNVSKNKKFGHNLDIYPQADNYSLVTVETETGHNQEFYDTKSTLTYLIIEGSGTFFLNDEPVAVKQGDLLSVEPNTRIYYKGKLKMVLITSPVWSQANEVETRPKVW